MSAAVALLSGAYSSMGSRKLLKPWACSAANARRTDWSSTIRQRGAESKLQSGRRGLRDLWLLLSHLALLDRLRQHHVLRLEISVDDLPVRVEVMQACEDLLGKALDNRKGDATIVILLDK
ncbi:MAG: hypothetical protein FRX49_01351 [Trebouxia sp. A1-2]|nr:MAG: hypothetical protein FRX49_01351 [Trebouxia sp. A1-2]